jgi:hypothetical protein
MMRADASRTRAAAALRPVRRVLGFALVVLALAGGAQRVARAQATAPAEPQPAPAITAPPPESPAPALPAPGAPPPEQPPAEQPPAEQPPPAAVAPAAPAPEPAPAAPAPPPPAPAAPVAPVAAPRPSELDEISNEGGSWIGAGIAVGLLNMPKLGIGLEITGEVRTPVMWPIELGVVYWLDNDDDLNTVETDLIAHPLLAVPYPPGGSSVAIQETMLSAALCPYEYVMTTGSFLACAGASGGILRASGEGFVDEKTVVRPLFQVDAYARWHFRLGGGVGITYSAGVFVPFSAITSATAIASATITTSSGSRRSAAGSISRCRTASELGFRFSALERGALKAAERAPRGTLAPKRARAPFGYAGVTGERS